MLRKADKSFFRIERFRRLVVLPDAKPDNRKIMLARCFFRKAHELCANFFSFVFFQDINPLGFKRAVKNFLSLLRAFVQINEIMDKPINLIWNYCGFCVKILLL